MSTKKIGAGALLLSTHISHTGPFKDQFVNAPLSVLMVRRGYKAPRFPGMWMPPTGYVDAREDLLIAAVREVREELEVHFSPEDSPMHLGEKDGVEIAYYRGHWVPKHAFPQLACNEKQIAENISFDMMPIEDAIVYGEANDFVYADALKLLL